MVPVHRKLLKEVGRRVRKRLAMMILNIINHIELFNALYSAGHEVEEKTREEEFDEFLEDLLL